MAPVTPPSTPSLPAVPGTAELGTAELGPPATKIARPEMMAPAQRYTETQWKVPQNVIEALSVCDPAKSRYWKRPGHITKTGQTVKGVPYCWGCIDSVDQFLEAVNTGTKLPGNVCAARNCDGCIQPKKTAGVDCSGFVSNVWRLSSQATTRSLPAVAQPLQSRKELKPGDILNKAGSHVVIYAGKVTTSSGENILIYESSLSCGGVCFRGVPWSQFKRYTPFRRQNISN